MRKTVVPSLIALVTLLALLLPVQTAAASTVTLSPDSDLAAVVAASPPGSVFELEAGTFLVPATVKAKAGDVFVGAGQGATVLVGAGADGIVASGSGVQVRSLSLWGFDDAVRLGSDSLVADVESGPNGQAGVQVSGDRTIVRDSFIHDNGRFGIYVNHASDVQIIRNSVIDNHTSSAWSTGNAGGIKVINWTRGVVIQGNAVTGTVGRGIWIDNDATDTQIVGNVVLGSTDEGIRLEKSHETVVTGNTTDTGFNSLNSDGGLVTSNTLSAPGTDWPIRFAGNGAKRSDGVEYANVGNRAEGNDVTLAGKQRAGVSRTAGTTEDNAFDSNVYHVPNPGSKWFSWWTGTTNSKLTWSGWRSHRQDLLGALDPGS